MPLTAAQRLLEKIRLCLAETELQNA